MGKVGFHLGVCLDSSEVDLLLQTYSLKKFVHFKQRFLQILRALATVGVLELQSY